MEKFGLGIRVLSKVPAGRYKRFKKERKLGVESKHFGFIRIRDFGRALGKKKEERRRKKKEESRRKKKKGRWTI